MAVLRELSKKLGVSPEEMVRAKEFAELKLAGNLNAQQYLQSMAKYPRTLERPIVAHVSGDHQKMCLNCCPN
jgi:arsenate reductase-like glutaredoxin family protein